MERKTSFILYQSFEKHFEMLSQKNQACLIMAIFRYERTGQIPEHLTRQTMLIFEIIRDYLERDRLAYEQRCIKNQENGALGGRPKKAKKTEWFFEKPKKPDTDTDTDSVSDSVSDSDSDSVSVPVSVSVSASERSETPHGRAGTRGEKRETRASRRSMGGWGIESKVTPEEDRDLIEAAIARSYRVIEATLAANKKDADPKDDKTNGGAF